MVCVDLVLNDMNALNLLHPEARNKSKQLLRAIRHLFKPYCVNQVWIFGSASNGKKAAPRDIDVAIICPHNKLHSFAEALAALFPSCAVERGDYTRTGGPTPGGMPFHFVVASFKSLSQTPRLSHSVRSGKCVVC